MTIETALTSNSFQPIEGGALVIQLPGERISACIQSVEAADRVIVRIAHQPFGGANHAYNRGDLVAADRTSTPLGEIWLAVAGPVQEPVTPSGVVGAAPALPRAIDPAMVPMVPAPVQPPAAELPASSSALVDEPVVLPERKISETAKKPRVTR